MKIAGTRSWSDLTPQQQHGLAAQLEQHREALNKVLANDPDAEVDVDLARVPVEFDVFWVSHRWLAYQNERARLGLDWETEQTSERTADGKPIEHGLRVFTNNLDRGTIDLSRASWSNARDGLKSLWFDVVLDHDYKGNPVDGRRESQNAERVATRFKGQDA